MVGTRPTTRPAARARSSRSRQTAAVSTTSISRHVRPRPRPPPAPSPAPPPRRHRRHRRPGQPRGQRRPRLVAGALVAGKRVEMPAEGGPVAAPRRAGQGRTGAERRHVVEGGPGQRAGRSRGSRPTDAATRSTCPSSATTWFAAMHAAAWYAARSSSAISTVRPPRQSTIVPRRRRTGHREGHARAPAGPRPTSRSAGARAGGGPPATRVRRQGRQPERARQVQDRGPGHGLDARRPPRRRRRQAWR